MKLTNRLNLTAGLLLVSGAAFGHAGHEAIGDGLHIEYLFAIGAAAIVAVYGLKRARRGGKD